MANYKVIQDIEAEDKLVGPFTLRQFIYAAIAVLCAYTSFLAITKNFPYIIALLLPIGAMSGFFAIPFTGDQPTEVWALAKIRFFFKPRRRIWDQSGVKDLVTINAPKQVITNYTDGLSESEVNSRLRALADTIDSRGWAIKNVNVNLFTQRSEVPIQDSPDRLIDPSTLPQDVPIIDIQASDDILDETSSPVARHFEQMITESAKTRREQIQEKIQKPVSSEPPADYWFMNQTGQAPLPTPGFATFQKSTVVAPGSENAAILPEPDDPALTMEIRQHANEPDIATSHLHKLQPLSNKPVTKPHDSVTRVPDSVKMDLASNNDRDVASLAREANQSARSSDDSQNEVVVPLH